MTPTTALPPEVRRGRNRLAAVVVAGHAIKHIYNSGLQAIILPEIKIGLGLSGAQFGLLASARSVTHGLATLTAGFLSDRFSHSAGPMLGISMGLIGGSLLVMGYTPSYWALFAAMLLVGIGPALYHPPAIGALSRRFPDRRGFALSLHGTGGIAGEVVGPLIFAGVLSLVIWQDALKASAIPALLTAFLIWTMMRSVTGEQGSDVASFREYVESITALLRNRALMLIVLAVALRSVGEGTVQVFLPVYLREDLGYTATRVAFYLSLAKVAGLVSQPAMGYLSDRFGRKAVIVPAATALSLFSFGLAFAHPGPQLLTVIIANGAFSFSLHHIFIAAAIDAARGHVQSTVVALIYAAAFLSTFSPYVAGLIDDAFGIDRVFVYAGSVLLLVCGCRQKD